MCRYETAAQRDECAPRDRLAMQAQLRQAGGYHFQTVVKDFSLSARHGLALGLDRHGIIGQRVMKVSGIGIANMTGVLFRQLAAIGQGLILRLATYV